jgi:dolichol-phosphate mannosyltransferase
MMPDSSSDSDRHLPAPELTIVVPTFNERDNVEILVGRLSKALEGISWEAVFVDDDSPDGTAALLRDMARHDPRVRVIQRIDRRGLSSAWVEGALASSAPLIASIDADLQHDEQILPEMLRRMKTESLDVAIGSRYVAGGGTGQWDSRRATISRLANRIAQFFFKIDLKDPMSGFFVIRREAFETSVRSLSQIGFKILLDLIYSSPRPLKVAEIPYQFRQRERGESKLDSMAGWQFGILIIDKLTGRYVPVRFVLFAAVGASGIFVSLLSLYLLLQAGLSFTVAQSGAVVVGMTSNFFLNNAITYRDRRLRGWAAIRGLLTFYLICTIGAVGNVGVASLLFSQHQQWWLAGLAGAAIGTVWNYVASRIFTWRGTYSG